MTHDTYSDNTHCYVSDLDRKSKAGRLLHWGYKYFLKAYKISNFQQIKSNIEAIAQAGKVGNRFDFLYVEEMLLDYIKIGICFENYMKAELLLHGYLAHNIANKEPYAALYKKQRTQPVKFEEFKSLSDYTYDERLGYNYLPGLHDTTLSYSLLLREKAYRQTYNIPTEVFKYSEEL